MCVSETRLQTGNKLLLVFAMHGMLQGNLLFAPLNPIQRTNDLCIQGWQVGPFLKTVNLNKIPLFKFNYLVLLAFESVLK